MPVYYCKHTYTILHRRGSVSSLSVCVTIFRRGSLCSIGLHLHSAVTRETSSLTGAAEHALRRRLGRLFRRLVFLDQLTTATAVFVRSRVRDAVGERSILVIIIQQVLATRHVSRSVAVVGPNHLHLAETSLARELARWRGGGQGGILRGALLGVLFSPKGTHTRRQERTRTRRGYVPAPSLFMMMLS